MNDFGLTSKQRKEQYSKKRDGLSCCAKRKNGLRTEKGVNLIKMVKSVVKHEIIAYYLLTDS
jgi:hypothetical protein